MKWMRLKLCDKSHNYGRKQSQHLLDFFYFIIVKLCIDLEKMMYSVFTNQNIQMYSVQLRELGTQLL